MVADEGESSIQLNKYLRYTRLEYFSEKEIYIWEFPVDRHSDKVSRTAPQDRLVWRDPHVALHIQNCSVQHEVFPATGGVCSARN